MRRNRSAKSLVEMLVVIAIIAVIGSIIFAVGRVAWKTVNGFTSNTALGGSHLNK